MIVFDRYVWKLPFLMNSLFMVIDNLRADKNLRKITKVKTYNKTKVTSRKI